ncbi:MAG: type II toxin-antitoxin system PemK/MazF family toxin [Burkholderiales bacterium]
MPYKPPSRGVYLFLGEILALGSYHPHPGDVLICDYTTGFISPEMVKKRAVVVISLKERHGGRLCTVVPLSTTAPNQMKSWHAVINVNIPSLGNHPRWAKCDMLATLSFDRLDKPHSKSHQGRQYHTVQITAMELKAIRDGVLAYLHF